MTVLVDTSVWVEYLRATDSRHDHWVLRVVDEQPQALAWTEPVLHELTSGARSAEHATRLSELLRSALDCLIATVAIRTGTPVLARDRDFTHLAAVSNLDLVEP